MSNIPALPSYRNICPRASRRQLRLLHRAHSISELRSAAAKILPRAVFDFYDGGSETESTLRRNRTAFEQIQIIPTHMNDVSMLNLSSFLAGTKAAMPFAISPTGAIGFGWPRGDIAIARAAGVAGVPYTLPVSSTASIERVAKEAPDTRLWFQAYMLKKRDYTMALIDRAKIAGYEALVFTVDMPTGGKRERDLRNDFGLPFKYTVHNVLDFSSRPSWTLRQLRSGRPVLENLVGFESQVTDIATIASSVGKNYDPTFNWDDLRRIRDAWTGPLLIKGVLHADEAEHIANIGCEGIIVSNHGGRQADCAIASLEALPEIVQRVGDRMEILIDGGIRRGTDIIKALALGACGVMAGRPLLYGVSVGGQDGAEHALTILREELERNMRLYGVNSLAAIKSLTVKGIPRL